MAHGQYAPSCRALSPPPTVSETSPLFAVVPSMCVAERYDTNIYYRPSAPGVDPKDFVTTVNPTLRVNHNGGYVSGFLHVGGFSETYAKNPGLNYIGTNNTLSLNFDNTIKRVLPNASLRVIDNVSYTPLPPGFVNAAAGTSPNDPGNIQNVYAQGFLGFRTNNLINNLTVSTAYATSVSTSLNASYSYGIVRFGSSPSTQGLTLFDTTTQTGAVGGAVRLSEVDILNVRYAHTQSERIPSAASTSGTSTTFLTDSAIMAWSRILTSNLSAELGGGGIVISPGITTYAANAALIMNYLNNSATISYARSAFPNLTGAGGTGGGMLIGDLYSLSATQKIDREWQLAEIVSYAHTSSAGGLNPVTYNSLFASGDIQYWVTNIWSAALTYSYTKFTSELGSVKSEFDRQVVTLSVRATWE